MKKFLSGIIMTVFLLSGCPFRAEAFILPPFKTDGGNIFQNALAWIRNTATSVQQTINESTTIQTMLVYGKGAYEAYSYYQSVDGDLKKMDYKKVQSIAADIKKAKKEKSEKKEKNAKKKDSISKESTAKIAVIDENTNKLEQDSLENPQNAAENVKKIAELEQQKDEITEQANSDINDINNEEKNELAKIDLTVAGLTSSLTSSLSNAISIKTLAKNYDSTEDLKGTVTTVFPQADTEITPTVKFAYRELYNQYHWQDLRTAANRMVILRTDLPDDNDQVGETAQVSTEMDGGTAATSIAEVGLKTENMKALLTFTELVLQRLKLQLSYDLANMGFNQSNQDTAIANFKFENYRLTDEDGEDEDSSQKNDKQYLETDAIADDIATPSAEAMDASLAAIAEYGEANATTDTGDSGNATSSNTESADQTTKGTNDNQSAGENK